MSKVRYIRIIFIWLALYMGAANVTWAQTSSCSNCAFSIATTDIKITPSGKGTVTVESIVHNTTEGEHNGEHTVTIVVVPVEGYCLKIGDIRVRKLVAPSSLPTPARAKAPEIADDLTVNGPNLVINSTSAANRKFTFIVPSGYDGAYIEAEFKPISEMYDGVIITEGGISYEAYGHYILLDDVDVSTSGGAIFGTQSGAFTGTFEGVAKDDGSYPKITGLTSALFDVIEGGTVKNIVLDDVTIGGSTTIESTDNTINGKTATGAIANVAKGAARIYNCGIQATGSTVKINDDGYTEITSCSSYVGSNAYYVGGLVGLLDETARVINCYSYADITSGSYVGGIVGYNNGTTTSANNNQNTMVMNCMFYGNITSGDKAPIYNGNIISNAGNTGVGNYNYFYSEASYAESLDIQTPNCALMAEGRFLQRFEFFRHLLNSHLELAGWWATNTYGKSDMAKWVLEPSQIGSSTPYPILKKPGRYHSVVNIDNLDVDNRRSNTIGTSKGTLTVKIRMGDGAVYERPSGAAITTQQLSLNITDKDPDHFNFNYHKVQLPYYNDVGTKNYTGNRVVTGWKIVSITGGTAGSFTTGDDSPAYNFADRNCTNKDLYSVSGRIFNQGAYWDVPEGVTAITIEPYWAKAAYAADSYADVVYNTDMTTATNVPNVGGGQKYTNDGYYTIAGESQKVYTSIGNAVTSLSINSTHTVYDYAVVLVGNLHQYTSKDAAIGGSNKYTVTTIDLDHDNEPDYSFMMRDDGRGVIHPLRWDFLNIVGLGMAQKTTGGEGSYNLGILIPKGWFETTNTMLFRVTQFEYEHSDHTTTDAIIVQGGVIEQWVSNNQKGTSNKIAYIHVGGNVWFKEFHTGCHQDKQIATKHSPVTVTGGDYDEFYLTGLYRGDITNKEDNAECYINGGRFGTVCGAAMEGIGKANGASDTGNITWLIQNADIHEFYAGGLNAAKPVTGNLSTTIIDSHVDIFCGGPKFGDMSANKTVVTNATGCTFGTFFGAGYGGNSYSRYAPTNKNNVTNIEWNTWVRDQYKRAYNATYGGVSTQFSYQFLPMSDNKTNVARILIDFVKFSLATTHSVTSTLTGCTIENNFYGGGNLGKVDGDVTSTLTDCTVNGSVFGAGYSASLPTVEVDNIGFETEPLYYTDFGTYRKGVKGATTTYTWKKKDGNSWVDNTNHFLYTTEDLTTLGAVTGTATLTINGSTTVAESVYGGGEESGVGRDTEVTVNNGIIGTQGQGATDGNVYGGGKGKYKEIKIENEVETEVELAGDKAVVLGLVKGNTNVTINGGSILHNVYGGGAFGSVGNFTFADEAYNTANPSAQVALGTIVGYTDGGTANVTITGGTIGTDGINNGMVFGSSRGDIDKPGSIHDRLAWVYDTHVIIGTSGQGTMVNTPLIKGSVYGSGENGHTYHNTVVDVHSGTIGIASGDDVTVTNSDNTTTSYKAYNYPYRGNVYGGGCGTDKYYSNPSEITGTHTANDGMGDKYNPLAGIVQGNATVNIDGGHVVHNVYGAGAMGSVGTITNFDDLDANYMHSDTKADGAFYDFGLSWPYEFTYGNTTGLTQVTITGSGVIGVNETDAKGGHVYGAARGAVDVGTNDITEQRYVEAKLANVRETQVTIGTANGTTTTPTIYGSVYGGGEDGHVYDNATVTIHHGRINHSVFGGGKGESTYNTKLWDATPGATPGQEKATAEPVHSWTAGKVYGNTTVTMNGGSVGYNIYGGGNLASVGKGNYAGGADDYMTVGYGELPAKNGNDEGNLWTNSTTEGTYPYYFMNSGKATVTINGGKVGVTAEGTHTGTDTDDNPYGNVFGSSRGKAALNVGQLSPRYRYVPDFFLGYVNETEVTIGGTGDGGGPEIYGSVYGGGQDGHVRRDTKVTINKCTIGHTDNSHTDAEIEKIGNVFGAGSGLGQYTKGSGLYYNNSSGSVTCTTTVEVNDNANILGNVYGGGALASVGPPNIGSGDEQKEVTSSSTHQSRSFTQVDITGGNISGNVYGASRGGLNLNYNGEDPNTYATDLYSTVNVSGGQIAGDVFGGGEAGQTKCDVEVNISGGIITKDVYGGGALAHTNTSNWVYNRNTSEWGDTWATGVIDEDGKTKYKTTVNLTGGQLRNAYGGGLGQIERAAGDNVTALESIEARVYGDVLVELNNNNNGGTADGDKPGCIVERVFGCNNQNGTPMGHVKVHVYATQNADTENYLLIKNKQALHTEAAGNLPETGSTSTYDVLAVYGGGNLSPYKPAGGKNTTENTEVIIDGCNLTSIRTVYGGGNAAPAPATYVRVNGTYEIEEVFGGGNGNDDFELYEKTYMNPGANVGYYNFTHPVWNSTKNKYETIDYTAADGPTYDASTKQKRIDNWSYGTGVARTEISGGKVHYVYGASNQRGNVRDVAISRYEEMDEGCPMVIDQTYGGGKNSEIDGRIDLGLGCVYELAETFGGSKNADVNSDIILRITNGTYQRVFGGNNTSGNVNGSITVNIIEEGCSPVRIGELYLGGYLAGYSIYGYKEVEGEQVPRTKEDWEKLSSGQKEAEGLTVPRKDPRINVISATRIDNIYGGGYEAKVVGNPHINVNMEQGKILAKYVDETTFVGQHKDNDNNVLWTGHHLGTDPVVVESEDGRITKHDGYLAIGTIGNIYGGGNRAAIDGNAYVEIGTGFWLNADDKWETKDAAGVEYTYDTTNDVWQYLVTTGEGEQQTTTLENATTVPTPVRYTANITGDVFGGGDNAAVQGNTYVNVCAVNNDDPATTDDIEMISVTLPTTIGSDVTIGGSVFGGGSKGAVGYYTYDSTAREYNFTTGTGISHVTIAGGTIGTQASPSDVFGGGMGEALNSGTGAFMCEKAMVDYTNVVISNGTVNGTVYGGGKIGRVNHDTRVTVGLKREANATTAVSTPVVEKSVFGAGKGLSTHGYAALVRGNSYVTVQGDAKVKDCVYGGGEIASVGKYTLDGAGMPQSLANRNSGYCTVIVQDNAEIGPDIAMKMKTESGYPDDKGHVFGAGRGILPYEGYDLTDPNDIPWRVKGNDQQQWFGSGTVEINGAQVSVEYDADDNQDPDYKKAYLRYIETQGLATQTYVTIGGNALVKGSVYGGSMNGHVQHNTQVTIAGGQIGCQKNTTGRLDASVWGANYQVPEGTDLECASWDFTGDHHPYDIYDYQTGTTKPKPATDGHTFFGNVFGGGSGYYPYRQDPDYDIKDQVSGKSRKDLGYADGLWHREAGSVGGSTVVNITGGHILTSVYGGNEQTDVGTYEKDSNYENTTTVVSGGKCTINMSGGTVGVPRTVAQMKAHPVTCYIFGAGKGDQRINFNKWTNVASTQVNISGNARIYGSTFGGGEDGHVVGNVETNIDGSVIIGTTGTSGVDGNIFGGGRGFSETALTAGVVGGDVAVNIHNGSILGSVFGGGRLASVGTHFADAESADYGTMQNTITPATYYTAAEIAAAVEGDDAYGKTTSDVKTPESIHGKITVTIDGGTIGATDSNGKLATSDFSIGDVFGGCKGSTNDVHFGMSKNTTVNISGANTKVNGNVYGGGEAGDVGTIIRNLTNYNYTWKNSDGDNNTPSNNGVTGTNKNSGICTVTITGGTIGPENNENPKIGNVFGAGKGVANTWWCEKAMAYATNVSISGATKVYGSVFGGGEVGRVEDDTKVTIGTSGGSDTPEIMGSVFGAGAGLATHGYSALVRGNSDVTVQGKAKVGVSVYGGGEIATVGRYVVVGGVPTEPDGGGSCTVIVKDNAEIAKDVFGAGQGVNPSTYNNEVGNENRSKRMMVYDSTRDTGEPSSSTWEWADSEHKYVWEYFTEDGYKAFLETLALASDTEVEIGGTTGNTKVKGSVYGGSESGFVQRDTDVKIKGGAIGTTGSTTDGNIFGGGKGIPGYAAGGRVSGNTNVAINGGIMHGSVYGGGENGIVKGGVIVNMADGIVNHDVYGGGALADTNTDNATNYGTSSESISSTSTYTTTVKLTGGTIGRDVYGGGLGSSGTTTPAVLYTAEDAEVIAGTKEIGDVKTPAVTGVGAVAALVYGDVLVTLNETKTEVPPASEGGTTTYSYNDNCVVKRNIFGCNNVNGTPKGDVTVHVYKTQGWTDDNGTESDTTDDISHSVDKNDDTAKGSGVYELTAVYGGGNQASYVPVDPDNNRSTEVIIDGCALTSIKTVYGGGNAASVPGTHVTVNSCYEIGTVFGGGNGKGDNNPGANVGYMPEADGKTSYGSGRALVDLIGGTVNKSFGGSNTLGDVRVSATVDMHEDATASDNCPLNLDVVYGAGNESEQTGDSKICLTCITKLNEVYAGANKADVKGNVEMTIQSGQYNRVFGGNNESGEIKGNITVNIEETGCYPIIIGQLYGAGNMAKYADGRNDGKVIVNAKSFTSIGEIYGGGYGSGATVNGDTYVYVNEFVGDHASEGMKTEEGHTDESLHTGETRTLPNGYEVEMPLHKSGAIGAVGTIYGGGNAATVNGNTHVYIGTKTEEFQAKAFEEGASVTGYYTLNANAEGTSSSDYTLINSESAKAEAGTTYYEKKAVIGADIRGNVYGGGNAAVVTGNTNVTIGKEPTVTTPSGGSGSGSGSGGSGGSGGGSGSGG